MFYWKPLPSLPKMRTRRSRRQAQPRNGTQPQSQGRSLRRNAKTDHGRGRVLANVRQDVAIHDPDPVTTMGTVDVVVVEEILKASTTLKVTVCTSQIWTRMRISVTWNVFSGSMVRSRKSGWPGPFRALPSSSFGIVRMRRTPSARPTGLKFAAAGCASPLLVLEPATAWTAATIGVIRLTETAAVSTRPIRSVISAENVATFHVIALTRSTGTNDHRVPNVRRLAATTKLQQRK